MIAALYVDMKGPYPSIRGVDCWDLERDATTFHGPGPVIAHPPCGHWGRYWRKAHDDGHTGPIAVEQVRRWGGVLEHPKGSKLWKQCGMAFPGRPKDVWGGWTLEVEQGDWGHPAQKPTWLYIVGLDDPSLLPAMPPRRPPPPRKPGVKSRGVLERMAKSKRHLTPRPFALWLVRLAIVIRIMSLRFTDRLSVVVGMAR